MTTAFFPDAPPSRPIWLVTLADLALLLLGYFADGAPLVILFLFGAYALFIGGAQVLELVYPNELFPTEIRYGGLSISFNIFVSAFAGTTSLIMSAVVLGTGWAYWPAVYLILAALAGHVAAELSGTIAELGERVTAGVPDDEVLGEAVETFVAWVR